LGDCYVRRDHVALITFRGRAAETLLEPTRSLVRAKRSLTGMPGGGPTPLAGAIRRSLEIAGMVQRRGQSPLIVYLTDGSGNIALDGGAIAPGPAMTPRCSLARAQLLATARS
jgi:magnesium chelatase subunit D